VDDLVVTGGKGPTHRETSRRPVNRSWAVP